MCFELLIFEFPVFSANLSRIEKKIVLEEMQNLEDEISKTAIFSRRGFGGKRKSKTEIDEKSLFKKLMKR